MSDSHPLIHAAQGFYALNFEYANQLLAALPPMFLTVVLHGVGMDLVRRYFRRFGLPLLSRPHVLGRSVVMSTIVGIMLAAHFSGIVAWAVFLMVFDLVPHAKDAMLFSVQNYTTLGSNITLHGRWSGFGGFEAMTGMLMFGWSTAVLAAVAQKMHSVDE